MENKLLVESAKREATAQSVTSSDIARLYPGLVANFLGTASLSSPSLPVSLTGD